ncbi:segregation/condensation protein A [Listeria monocytogenes]|uniref:segregation/condensation protein A n=1 Tax=Listeria monocytogenes TaxID=1639 RepID=UPI00083E15B4|nr:segregation/condensation protein A [Listeria monocytogenes]EAD3866689.1 segregation/condensation protein A [Listeria monocytogenes]EAG5590641.1 segregation/condensation protein A [Listeria monocytogenes]EAK9246537.1 segregation/condensation protein A [Listeria monocytogenes]EAK9267822.1 segregation/condensation protein A [Listeria monocytogenes]ECP7788906.1 segregation/condensation protein A [Listeria monocytogenes]
MVEMNFKVDAFEGPLDLLLHLIGQLEVDIYDIPMAEITDQYMEFVHTMQEMELDVASEYLVMAATLLAIKSKMLLPKQELEIDYDTLEEEEDPRDALVEKLMEYKRFKEAAKELKEKEAERSFYFSKPPMDLAEYDDGAKVAELDVSLNDMLSAFNKMLRRKKLNKPLHTRITTQEISIDQRMDSVLEKLNLQVNHRLRFDELFEEQTKEQLVVTFLALLELMKRKLVEVEQAESFADLYVQGKGEEIS